MNWEKLKPIHYFSDPVKHIYTQNIFDTKEYDVLYENQLDINNHAWQDFDTKYKIGFEVKENFNEIDYNKAVMCLWFFKERSHLTPAYINLAGKSLQYMSNTFLITESKQIKFENPAKKYNRYPLIQLDLPMKVWKNILERFDKVS